MEAVPKQPLALKTKVALVGLALLLETVGFLSGLLLGAPAVGVPFGLAVVGFFLVDGITAFNVQLPEKAENVVGASALAALALAVGALGGITSLS